MEVAEKKERQKGDLKNKILVIARDIAIREGWHAVSMRKIAGELEYSVPIIYDYFENKEQLLSELRQIGFSILNEYIRQAIAEERAPQRQITNVGRAYGLFVADYPEYYHLMFNMEGELPVGSSDTPEFLHTLQLLRETVQWLHPPARHDQNLADELAGNLWALLHGTIALARLRLTCPAGDQTASALHKALERFVKSVAVF